MGYPYTSQQPSSRRSDMPPHYASWIRDEGVKGVPSALGKGSLRPSVWTGCRPYFPQAAPSLSLPVPHESHASVAFGSQVCGAPVWTVRRASARRLRARLSECGAELLEVTVQLLVWPCLEENASVTDVERYAASIQQDDAASRGS
jgi:hypothetical protein